MKYLALILLLVGCTSVQKAPENQYYCNAMINIHGHTAEGLVQAETLADAYKVMMESLKEKGIDQSVMLTCITKKQYNQYKKGK